MPVNRTLRPSTLLPRLITPVFLISLSIHAESRVSETMVEEVVITATLQRNDSQRTAATVIDSQQIATLSAQHLETLLSRAPNVNTASGASRGRFFQIRGIGERSQFVEPVNASVALLLDGIDLTGLGGAATTWDLAQVEVLRGPQGTLFGANALAGLINLQSTPTSAETDLLLSAGVESNNGHRIGFAGGTQIAPGVNGRIAIQQYQSDGYITNDWLMRDDTNHLDELTARLALSYETDNQRWDVGLYRIDVDNGYDAFSLDNTRRTLSDQPGRDATETDAARIRWQRTGTINLSAQLSAADTSTVYSYDEDWSYVGIAPDWEYSSFDEYQREREMQSFELRADRELDTWRWIIGSYFRSEDEQLQREYTYLDQPFGSRIMIDTAALFGQVDVSLSNTVSVFLGARIERRETDYRDSDQVDETINDTLWSGRMGLNWQLSDQSSVYVALSRGVRSGGFNANLLASIDALPPALGDPLRGFGTFDEESLVNTELGWRWRSDDGALISDLTMFTMARKDQQAKRSLTIPRPDGSTAFIDYTDNAAEGSNDGLEWQLNWQLNESVALSAALGLLRAEFDRYITADGDDLSGRDQPQAPNAMGQLGIEWRPAQTIAIGIEMTAMDSYFFSDRHDTRSPSRQLVNAHATWTSGSWELRLWSRNLLDEDVFVRGFGSFGNDPRKEYVVEPYYQYGEPRVIGLTATFRP